MRQAPPQTLRVHSEQDKAPALMEQPGEKTADIGKKQTCIS